jgi:hypothetical protein
MRKLEKRASLFQRGDWGRGVHADPQHWSRIDLATPQERAKGRSYREQRSWPSAIAIQHLHPRK